MACQAMSRSVGDRSSATPGRPVEAAVPQQPAAVSVRLTVRRAAILCVCLFGLCLGGLDYVAADPAQGSNAPKFTGAAKAYLQRHTLAFGVGRIDPDYDGLRPPHCTKLADMLDDPGYYNETAYHASRWIALPCVTWVLMKLAAPYRYDDFSPTAPMDDIWRRLDMRFHPMIPRASYWHEYKKPIRLPGHPEHDRETRTVLGPRTAEITSFTEGRRDWHRDIYYLGRADWTGDGRADLLVGWGETAAPPATYYAEHLLILTTAGPDRAIHAIAQVDWTRENLDRVRPLLAGK